MSSSSSVASGSASYNFCSKIVWLRVHSCCQSIDALIASLPAFLSQACARARCSRYHARLLACSFAMQSILLPRMRTLARSLLMSLGLSLAAFTRVQGTVGEEGSNHVAHASCPSQTASSSTSCARAICHGESDDPSQTFGPGAGRVRALWNTQR